MTAVNEVIDSHISTSKLQHALVLVVILKCCKFLVTIALLVTFNISICWPVTHQTCVIYCSELHNTRYYNTSCVHFNLLTAFKEYILLFAKFIYCMIISFYHDYNQTKYFTSHSSFILGWLYTSSWCLWDWIYWSSCFLTFNRQHWP